MTLRPLLLASASASLALAAFAAPARADEGMWTFDAFPAARVRQQYGWAPDQAWLDNVRAAAVRLTGGCSASFVSPTGLVLTNHHCVVECVQDRSTAQNDLVRNGFTAATRRLTERRRRSRPSSTRPRGSRDRATPGRGEGTPPGRPTGRPV